jgi:hypothetical protein
MENTTPSPSRKAWRGWSRSRTGTKIVRSERAVPLGYAAPDQAFS